MCSVTTATIGKRNPEHQLLGATAASTPPPSKKAKVQEESELTAEDIAIDAEIENCFFGKPSNCILQGHVACFWSPARILVGGRYYLALRMLSSGTKINVSFLSLVCVQDMLR